MRRRSSNKVGHGSSEKWNPGRFLLDVDAEGDPLDLEGIFPERGGLPLEIEIGTGKGTFILARAEQRPEINFLGIEYAYPYAAYTADRIRRAGLENARMICADASAIVQNRIGDETVLRLHIYFPDPWPKRKHHRRRLVQPAFVDQARRILVPGGQLLLVTDHEGYFQQMQRVLTDAPGFINTDFPVLLEDDRHIVGTNFEKKYTKEGRRFFRLAKLKYDQATD